MKIAVVTDDGKTISAHFGRATKYAVWTVEEGQIVSQELRDKLGHQDFAGEEHHDHDSSHDHADHAEQGHGHGKHSAEKHQRMFAAITDCNVLLARGMGQGAFTGLEQAGIHPIVTDVADVETAVSAFLNNSLIHYPERLH